MQETLTTFALQSMYISCL